jgi:Cyclic nucleotide-binding domain
MRIESSVTSISWIPIEAVEGLAGVAFDVGLAHYDLPPPPVLGDLDAMRRADRFRFANELRAWVEVVDGGIVNYGHLGHGYLGSTTLRIGPGSITFQAVGLPDLRPTPQVSATSVRFVQTAGGRAGVPAPRYVDHPPYLRVAPPMVWTTLALTIHADGSSDYEMVGASPFPRHWIYDQSGRQVAKSGLIEFRSWHREAFGSQTPWGGIDTPALIRPAVSDVQREISDLIMGRSPTFERLEAGQVLVRQGDPGNQLFLLLDGLLSVEVDGTAVAEVAPGAVLGELALLRGGRRQATLRATTPCRVARVRDDQIDRASLERLTQDREATSNQPHGSAES